MPILTDTLNEDIKELKGDVHKLAIGLAELRQEVRDAIGLAKWAGTVVMGVLLTSGVGAVIWGASLTAKVYGMEARTGEKFQEVGIRIDKLEVRLDGRIDKLEANMNARFDKLEASIVKALDQLKPAVATPPK